MPKLVLVAAMSRNGVIGIENRLPWGMGLPRDMARFKAITTKAGVVLMGRKTADSLPRPLLGRRNLVLSKSQLKGRPGFEHYATVRAALASCKSDQTIAVMGGSEIYRLLAPHAHRAYLTLVDAEFSGDALFPYDALAHYERMDALQTHESDEKNAHRMHFVTARNTNIEPI